METVLAEIKRFGIETLENANDLRVVISKVITIISRSQPKKAFLLVNKTCFKRNFL